MKKYWFFLLLLIFTCQVFASSYREVVFFGDSLSDNGNLYATMKVIPKSPPYFEGRFSNGPTWAEYLGDYFHQQSNADIQNYAVGGATAILHNPMKGALPYILKEEVNKYLDTHHPQEDSLFAIWIGGNDYLDERREDINQLAIDVVEGTVSNIILLISHGARNFLIMDLPDLSKIPYTKGKSNSKSERLIALSQLHHVKLADAVRNLQREYPDLKFLYVDAYDLFNDIVMNTDFYNQKYHAHLTNTTDACWEGGYMYKNLSENVVLAEAENVALAFSNGKKPCTLQDEYIFWDQIHPTTVMHRIFSEIVEEKLLS